jgi:hypothetical protein
MAAATAVVNENYYYLLRCENARVCLPSRQMPLTIRFQHQISFPMKTIGTFVPSRDQSHIAAGSGSWARGADCPAALG